MKYSVPIVTIIFLLLSYNSLFALPFKNGNLHFPLTNYTSEKYNADPQNWSINELNDGTLCIGNGNGLLTKNGNTWQLHTTAHKQRVSYLFTDRNTVYCGGGTEFGYFTKLQNGKFVYHQLSDLTRLKWGEIWKIEKYKNYVYYQGGKAIFQYNIQTKKLSEIFKAEEDGNEILYFGIVQRNVYLQTKLQGLLKLNLQFESQQTIRLNTTKFLSQIRQILYFNNSIYLCTLSKGLYKIDNNKIESCHTLIQNRLIKNQIYCATVDSNLLIIGTILDGVYLIDKNMKLVRTINITNQLQNNTILSLFVDTRRNLWAGLDNGISQIKIFSNYLIPFFHSQIGTGYAYAHTREGEYWGTNQGLFYMPYGQQRLQLVEHTQGLVWTLFKIGNQLFCGHHKGLYLIKGSGSYKINDNPGFMKMIPLHHNNYYLSKTYYKNILFKVTKTNQLQPIKEMKIEPNIPLNTISDRNGNLWFNDSSKLVHITIDYDSLKILSRKVYDKPGSKLFNLGSHTLLIDHNNLFELTKDTFEHLDCLMVNYQSMAADLPYLAHLMTNEDDLKFFIGPDRQKLESLFEIRKLLKTGYGTDYFYDDHYILNTNDGFIYQYPSVSNNLTRDLTVNFIQILVKENRQSNYQYLDTTVLKSEQNNLIFKFNANNSDHSFYQFRLEGLEQNWSVPGSDRIKEYSNLPPGSYTFLVKALQNEISGPVSKYSFRIEYPFYETKTAIAIYIFLILISIFILYRCFKKVIQKKEQNVMIQKQKEIEEMEKLHHLQNLQNEKQIILMENEKLEAYIDHKRIELTNATHNIVEKNNILSQIKAQLQTIYRETNVRQRDLNLKQIFHLIDSHINKNEDWSVFENYFSEIHQNFFDHLKKEYPSLSSSELKLCAYLKLNKTTKEIASLMNITVRGVETARYRLRKKLEIERNEDILAILSKF